MRRSAECILAEVQFSVVHCQTPKHLCGDSTNPAMKVHMPEGICLLSCVLSRCVSVLANIGWMPSSVRHGFGIRL